MNGTALATIDLVVIGVYFAIVFGIGIAVARKTERSDQLFLAGRSLTFGAIGFSLFASNISSSTLIGLTGGAYSSGISASNYEWMAAVVLVFAVFFFIPFFIQTRVTTVPEFLGMRFDGRSQTYFSVLSIVTSIMIDTAGGIYAGTVVLRTFFPDLLPFISDPNLDFIMTCGILALIAGLYTAAGGLAAVVYTDLLQSVVLLVGSTAITVVTLSRFDFSWTEATAGLPDGHLSLIRPLGSDGVPWLGTLTGVPILGLYYWVFNQYIVQRVLGAKNLAHARWGAVLGGGLKLLPLFVMVLPGAFALNLFPDIENQDQVFPILVTRLLPAGAVGLVLAGLVAAIMSSIDSTLNSASTLVTNDFVKARYPNLSEKKLAWVGRGTTIALMIVAACWAPAIRSFPGLWSYIQAMLAYLVPPVFTIFVFGIFWKRTHGNAAFTTLVVGHLLSAVTFVFAQDGILFEEAPIQIHFTILCGILTAVNLGLCALLVLATKTYPTSEQTHELTWSERPRTPPAQVPLWKDFRLHSSLVMGFTVIMLILFW